MHPKKYNPNSPIVTMATTPYIKGASETNARMYYNLTKYALPINL